MNRVTISGRLTKDLELKQSKNGVAVANFTLAVNSRYKGKSEADFIPCVLFGAAAEHAVEYLKKSTKIEVEGRLQSGSYMVGDRRVSTMSLVVSHWEFAERKMPTAAETPAETE